ncbi:MAG: DUF1232 domain-containing protein [Saprospiraceae bacterium]|nr:DUF1232 domain-containing protein [Saprospiraceae bacterium]
MQTPKEFLARFKQGLEEIKFLNLLKAIVRKASIKTIYVGLLLFHAYQRTETPLWAKRMVLGTLAYLLAPIDAIPDLSPFIGFTDDFGLLMFGLVSIAGYVNQDVRLSARTQLEKWFGTVGDHDLLEVEETLRL